MVRTVSRCRLLAGALCVMSLVTGAAVPLAAGALPNTSSPTLSLIRTIRTSPFVGTSTSVTDNEGGAFVPNSAAHPNREGTDSLFYSDDDGKSLWEFNPYTGVLKGVLRPADWGATRQYNASTDTGSGAFATSGNWADLEGVAYDRATDTLYAFNGSCCSSSVKPAVFRLRRAPDGSFRPESWQALPSSADYTGAAWNPADGKLYVGVGSSLRTYDYRTNVSGSTFSISGVSGIFGLSFSDSGADLFVVTSNVRLFRVRWATKTVMPGWSFDLKPHGILDSRAVELINDQFYVFDGYDYRSSGSPLARAVFVLGVCCDAPGAAPTASFNAAQLASPPRTMQFTDTSSGSPTSWSWTFGDGTSSTSQSPSHTYATAGTYTVTLVASNANGSSSPVSQQVNVAAPAAPTASFTAAQLASPPRTMQFTDTSTGGPTSWSWTFGDGTSSTSQSPSHTYAAAGTYTVTLVASSANGSSAPVSQQVNVAAPAAPTASFSAAQLASPPLTMQFTDTSTGGPTSWSWTFGDGTSSTSQSPSHTYAAAGTYTVTLVASNANGSSAPVSQQVNVAAPASQTVFNAIADTYAVLATPTTSYGTDSNIHIKQYSSNDKRGYFKFSVSGLAGRTVTSAKLRMYVTDPSVTGGSAFSVSSDWIETGAGALTWNNKPNATGGALSTLGAVASGTWVEFDVTPAISGDGTYSFLVTSTSGDTVYYASRESANDPQLVLTLG